MAPYRIELHDEYDAIVGERHMLCAHDDEAIDRAGWIEHQHAMRLWQGDRLVAHFPPWLPEGSRVL